MADRFVKWEGDIFKIVETSSGFDAFKLVNNSWERVSGKLIATLDFEGILVDTPTFASGFKKLVDTEQTKIKIYNTNSGGHFCDCINILTFSRT